MGAAHGQLEMMRRQDTARSHYEELCKALEKPSLTREEYEGERKSQSNRYGISRLSASRIVEVLGRWPGDNAS